MSTLGAPECADIAAAVEARCGMPGSGAAALAEWLGLDYRTRPGGRHDLTGPQHDQPPRTPHRTLVLAATYRSGSTVLAEGLYRAGNQGCPLEYFQSPARYPRFAGPDYRRQVMRHRTDASGTFGVKLFPPEAGPDPLVGLPEPVVVRVDRHDRVAQAVSALRALQTGRWRSTDPLAAGAARYDFSRLWQLVGMFEAHARYWDSRSDQLPVIATVDHDRLRSDPRGTLLDVLTALRAAGRPAVRPAPTSRLVPLSRPGTDPWAARFVHDVRRTPVATV